MAERYHFACGAHVLLRAAAQLGVTEDEVLRDAGLTRGELPPGACRMPWSKLRAVTASALKLTREPALGLIAGIGVVLDDFGIPGCYLINMPTVGECMRFAWTEVYPYTSNMFSMRLAEDAHRARILVETTAPADPLFAPHAHIFLGKHLAASRGLLGPDVRFHEFRLKATGLGDPQKLQAITGIPVLQGQEEDSLVVPSETLRRSVASSHPWVREMLKPQFDAFMADLKADRVTALTVLSTLERYLMAGETPDLGMVAEALHQNPRTLRAHLANEGTSFRDVLDTARKDMVMRHLSIPGVKLGSVALQLGFSDQAAFTRAFRRWTGSSPKAWLETQVHAN